jgi:hypothetical protein
MRIQRRDRNGLWTTLIAASKVEGAHVYVDYRDDSNDARSPWQILYLIFVLTLLKMAHPIEYPRGEMKNSAFESSVHAALSTTRISEQLETKKTVALGRIARGEELQNGITAAIRKF